MSSAEHTTTHHTVARRRVLAGLVPSALGIGLAVLLTGCGAGQLTQTASQAPAVNGASGDAGPIAIRNAQLAPPNNAQGTYEPGSQARLVVTIVNKGLSEDTLVKITSPAAESITIDGSATGTKALPGEFAVASGMDSDDMVPSAGDSAEPTTTTTTEPTTTEPTTTSSAPTSGASNSAPTTTTSSESASSVVPTPPAKITIELVGIKSINGGSLRAGLTIPITFYFAHAGQATLQVPVGAPADSASLASSTNG